MNKSLFLFSTIALLAACTQPESKVKMQVKSAIHDNLAAKTLGDWHSSESHPERLFAQWNAGLISGDIKSSDVCDVLKSTEVEKLTLFEEEVRSKGNETLLKDCRTDLIERLEKYWKDQRDVLNKGTTSTSDSTEEEGATPVDISGEIFVEQNDILKIGKRKFADNIQYRDTSEGYYALTADVKPKEVLLTFDDGPHPQYTQMILDAMEERNAKALFFHQGRAVRANPEMVRKVARAGHSVGTHSTTHLCLPAKQRCKSNNGKMLTHQEAINEIRGGHQAVYNVLGWVDPFFRFPFGESSTELKQYLAENGVGEFYWSVDSEDWKTKSPQAVIDDTMAQLRKRGRGNLLFHDVQRRTAEALPKLLETLMNEGYSVVLLKSADDSIRYNSPLVNLN